MKVAIDLDGTLLDWDVASGGKECGAFKPGGLKALRTLLDQGVGVIIHTCRVNWLEGGGAKAVMDKLRRNGFKPVEVTVENTLHFKGLGVWVGEGKPIASAYIDDRAVPFEGNWNHTLNVLHEFLAVKS